MFFQITLLNPNPILKYKGSNISSVIPLAIKFEIKTYATLFSGFYKLFKKSLETAHFGRIRKKNRLKPKLIQTLIIFTAAYRIGFSLARYQTNGNTTSASKARIQSA